MAAEVLDVEVALCMTWRQPCTRAVLSTEWPATTIKGQDSRSRTRESATEICEITTAETDTLVTRAYHSHCPTSNLTLVHVLRARAAVAVWALVIFRMPVQYVRVSMRMNHSGNQGDTDHHTALCGVCNRVSVDDDTTFPSFPS